MLAGLEEPDTGAITKPVGATVGYLPQDGLSHEGRSLRDEASLAFAPLIEARAEIERIEHELADPALPDGEHEHLLVRYHELTEFFRQHEGYSIELRVTQVLEGLGFSKADFDKPTETFSGGWQMRIALAKLLLVQPTLLLLDEPTNHLDLDARNWLESFLAGYPHAVILVSHDRYFLDAVVTRIGDISLRTITDYVGTYSHYLVERETRLDQRRKAKHEQDEEIARMRAFIDRFRYQATKAAQVQSRIKMLDRDRADRGAARAQARALHVSRPAPRAAARSSNSTTCTRPTAIAGRLRPPAPAHRARRPHRAGRAQRRGQIHADADARRRRGARPRARGVLATRSSRSTSRRTRRIGSTRPRRSTKCSRPTPR